MINIPNVDWEFEASAKYQLLEESRRHQISPIFMNLSRLVNRGKLLFIGQVDDRKYYAGRSNKYNMGFYCYEEEGRFKILDLFV